MPAPCGKAASGNAVSTTCALPSISPVSLSTLLCIITIYEITKPDGNGMWWSMFYKIPIGKWIFLFQPKHIVEGEISYYQTVGSCSGNVQGKSIRNVPDINCTIYSIT